MAVKVPCALSVLYLAGVDANTHCCSGVILNDLDCAIAAVDNLEESTMLLSKIIDLTLSI